MPISFPEQASTQNKGTAEDAMSARSSVNEATSTEANTKAGNRKIKDNNRKSHATPSPHQRSLKNHPPTHAVAKAKVKYTALSGVHVSVAMNLANKGKNNIPASTSNSNHVLAPVPRKCPITGTVSRNASLSMCDMFPL